MKAYKCPRCKKVMKQGSTYTYWYRNYWHACSNPKCYLYGIPRILREDEIKNEKENRTRF